MSKQSDWQNGRMDGLALALQIVKDGGVEALEKECRMRGAWRMNTSRSAKELDKLTDHVKSITYQTTCCSEAVVSSHVKPDGFAVIPKHLSIDVDAERWHRETSKK